MIADKELDIEGVMDALRDFLREWYPKARVVRISRGQAQCDTTNKDGRYIRCETGGDVGQNADFCLPAGQTMDLGGVLTLAKMINADWENNG